MSMRRLTLTTLASLWATAIALACWCVSARAEVTHHYLSQITAVPAVGPHGEAVPVPGPLSAVTSMTISEGDLYAVEYNRLDVFDASSGAFVSQFPSNSLSYYQGVAVGNSTGEAQVYVGADDFGSGSPEGVITVLSPKGELKSLWRGADTPNKAFGCFQCGTGSASVAVDGSGALGDWAAGDVYVAMPGREVIDVFKPEAGGGEKFVTELTGTGPEAPFHSLSHVAIDQLNGDVVIANGSKIDVLEPEPGIEGIYKPLLEISGAPGRAFQGITSVATDPESGEIYVTEETAEEHAVYELSAGGAYLGRILGGDTPAGGFRDLLSVAVDPVSHDVYVNDANFNPSGKPTAIDVFGPNVVLPDVTTGPVVALGARSATLTGTVNPQGAGPATCRFSWGTTAQLGQTAPCSEQISDGSGAVPARATLDEATGARLEPDTTYHYRLQATNQNGTNPGEALQDQEFTTLGPGMHSQSVADVSASSATLDATINPHEAPTTYYFQYGVGSGYGAYVPALSASSPRGRTIGSGEGDVEVAQHLQGLQAGAVYHFRVVVFSEMAPGRFEEFDGPDETFTTQSAGGGLALADNRVWEMVSSPEKHGADLQQITEQNGLIVASGNGDALTYVANVPTENGPQGFADTVQILATRDSSGWTSQDLTIAHAGATGQSIGYGPEYRYFSNDLSAAVVQPMGPFNPALSSEASEATTFLHTDYLNGVVDDTCATSCYRPLVTSAVGFANVPTGTVFGGPDGAAPGQGEPCLIGCGPQFVGATPDLSHVVVESDTPLLAGGGHLYEWTAGHLMAIGSGELGGRRDSGAGRAISSDGSRIILTGEAEGLSGLLMHDLVKGETVKLDAVQAGGGEGLAAPIFQGASVDGSKVFFTDSQRLTADSGAVQERPDLYECEMIETAGKLSCSLSDLTPIHSGESADVQPGVLGISEDGSRVYFAAGGALGTTVAPAPCAGEQPTATCNLYVLHNGGGGWEAPKLVAVLSEQDQHDWSEFVTGQPASISPNGRWLAFMSQRRLTAYDNHDAASDDPDAEVYLYDAETGDLRCASCDPTGARPVGVEYRHLEPGSGGLVGGPRGVWIAEGQVAANVPGWQQTDISGHVQDYQSRYLSDSGRLFFDSDDALVPQDVNGTQDVYEYEPTRAGDCETTNVGYSTNAGGCIDLISSGTSPDESAFLDASEGGADVFFLTSAKLLSQDFDTSLDIYNAHECTTQSPCPAESASPPPPCVTGDACKAPPTPQPSIYGAPASATFTGAGNVAPATHGGIAKAKKLTRAQSLAKALRVCRKQRKRRRAACERKARRAYGHQAGKSTAKKGRNGR